MNRPNCRYQRRHRGCEDVQRLHTVCPAGGALVAACRIAYVGSDFRAVAALTTTTVLSGAMAPSRSACLAAARAVPPSSPIGTPSAAYSALAALHAACGSPAEAPMPSIRRRRSPLGPGDAVRIPPRGVSTCCHGRTVASPAWYAVTIGAQPAYWLTKSRGGLPITQPASRRAANAW
jgi:hypothetical protein